MSKKQENRYIVSVILDTSPSSTYWGSYTAASAPEAAEQYLTNDPERNTGAKMAAQGRVRFVVVTEQNNFGGGWRTWLFTAEPQPHFIVNPA